MSKANKFTVYYDGLCKICNKEIDVYKKKDVSHIIKFVDISLATFDAKSLGLDAKKVRAVFHVQDSEGQWQLGVDGFVAIWDELGIFKGLSKMAKSRFTRPFFDGGYVLFTKLRPFLPKNKCDDDSCEV